MVELKNISKEYVTADGFKKSVLKNVSCQIQEGKITSIIAAKNSGLTTLCKIICDLETASSGEIERNSKKEIVYLPSEPSSFPWRNVFDNVTLGLKNFDKNEIVRLIKLVGLDGYEKFHPHKDSLGFRFRISLARSLAHKPSLIVIDDCFRSMDHQTRNEIYSLIKEVNSSERIDFFIATTNVTEALLLSDRIYLLKKQPGEVITHFDIRKYDVSEMDSAEFISWRVRIESEFKKITPQSLNGISI
ncbi:MAG: ATP-binding cassette domain-containing protein [Bacteroidetes bacterium]|nr:ATP-binding cassette domain-containing protein [Bacteroidota bacterium]